MAPLGKKVSDPWSSSKQRKKVTKCSCFGRFCSRFLSINESFCFQQLFVTLNVYDNRENKTYFWIHSPIDMGLGREKEKVCTRKKRRGYPRRRIRPL